MRSRDIWMGSQPTLELIYPDLSKNWVERIDGNAALAFAQVIRKFDYRYRCVWSRPEEERYRKPLGAGWWCDNVVNISPDKAIRCKFEEFAGVDDKRAGYWRSTYPVARFGADA